MLAKIVNNRGRAARLVVVLALCLSLTSCSTKMAYNFLDWGLMWYVERYVSLNDEQKALAKKTFDDFHQWHRETQLPRYAEYLQGLKTRLNQEVTPEQLHWETDQMQLMLDESVAYLLPSAVEIISSFSDEQVAEFLEKLAEDREEYREDYIEASDTRVHKRRQNELKDRIDPFFGRLVDTQKQWIDEWSVALEDYEPLMLEQQKTWAQQLEAALKNRQDKKALDAQLREIMFYRSDDWHPKLEKQIDINQALTFELMARMVNTMTERQRDKMNGKLSDYIEVFTELHADLKDS